MKVGKVTLITFLTVLSLAGCQQDVDTTGERSLQGGNMELEYIADSQGQLYRLSCIRSVADQIQREGRTAMNQCAVSRTALQSDSDAGRGRLFHGAYSSSTYDYALYYYWLPNYWSQYGNDYACSWIFGKKCWSNNWYSTYFGFNSSYWSSYNGSCNYCYYYSGSSYKKCVKACWKSYNSSSDYQYDVNFYYY